MCYMTVLCCLFFLPFFFPLLFFFLVFFLVLFVNDHKISIIPTLCPNKFFVFFTKFFLWLLFHLSDLSIITFLFFFLNSINLSFTRALSIQFSSYFVINNAMLFDFVLTFKTRTIVSNVRTYSIYICINLTIVVIFIHNIFIFVFI